MLSPLTHEDPAHLGAYRLIARLGSGGMGTVYLARTRGGRTVALKTMHAAIAGDPAARTRFRLETDAARIIGTQHGAAVVDADPLAETPWLATEYVLGPPLDDAVTLCGPLPEPSVRALGAALAGALAQLHSSDVVHRDLKPSNVMITAHGPKVIDFGIARAAGDERLTRLGVAAGTPAFMSPEQATGQEHTPAGDVFALAGVLVYAATGHGPFGTGQAADLIYRVRYAEPDLSGVPAPLLPLLARALAKDPAERPTTAQLAAGLHDGRGEFADHLPDLLLAEIARRATEVWQHAPYRLPAPAPATDPGPSPFAETVAAHAPPTDRPVDRRVGRRVGRRRFLAVYGGSALAVVAGGVGAWSWFSSGEDKGGAAKGGTGAPPSGAAPEPGPGRDAPADRRQPWRRNITGPKSGRPVLAPLPAGDAVALMTGEGLLGLAGRSGERRWLVAAAKEPLHVHTDGKQFHALLPGGGSGGHRLRLHTVDPVSGRTSPAAPFATSARPLLEAALLSVADGTAYLAAQRAGSWTVLAVDVRTGREKWSSPLRAYGFGSAGDLIVAALSGGRLVLRRPAAGGGGVDISAFDTRTGRQVWETTVRGETTAAPAYVPNGLAADGTHVYVGGGRVQALRLGDGAVAWTFGAGRPAGAYGIAPALRGGVVYAVEKGSGVVALGAADGRLRWEARTEERPDLAVPPVVDGKHVFVTADGTVRAVLLATHKEDWSFTPRSSSLSLHESAQRLIQTDGKEVVAIRLDFSSLL
ncbi:PQQ-binding-like beta-propeller repeat protein [Streptomyces sp. NPDC000410]|uniref:outer membrane protein assembly factor BamB family protein n=1 Tax=Streptomyces sp. NPDC000410 TaxID=3154254 RepID=UPI00332763AF